MGRAGNRGSETGWHCVCLLKTLRIKELEEISNQLYSQLDSQLYSQLYSPLKELEDERIRGIQ
jgi:hypothetical protein